MKFADMSEAMRERAGLQVDGMTRQEGDCLVFLGALQGSKPPTTGTSLSGQRFTLNVRRFLWECAGKSLPDGFVLIRVCPNPRCVAPAHSRCVSRAEAGSRSGKIITPKRQAQILRLAASRAKLTPEQRRAVLAWEGSWREAIEHFGISRELYYRTRRGGHRGLIADAMQSMVAQLRRAA